MFSHHNDNGKCEWFGGGLEHFVSHYNQENGTNYGRTECLDVVKIGGATPKKPEVLVTDSVTGKEMVIERKSVVWPPDYIHRHNLEHAFADAIWASTAGLYRDDCYQLTVSGKQMEQFKSSKVAEIAKEIGSVIASLPPSDLPVTRTRPVRWTFEKVDKEIHEGRTGIVVEHTDPGHLEDFLDDSAKAGTTAAISKELSDASKKFRDYLHAARVVLLDFYGTELWEDDIPPLMVNVSVPSNIDEVWRSMRDWVSADDFEVGYERLFMK